MRTRAGYKLSANISPSGRVLLRRVSEYTDDCEGVWTDYIKSSPQASIAHQIGFRKVIKEGLGNSPIYLMVRENDRISGVLPLFLVRTWWNVTYLISVPWLDYGGICADNLDSEALLLEKAQQIAEREKAVFIELRSERRSKQQLDDLHQRVTFLMDLTPGSEVIWKSFDPKLRNQIRKSQNSGLTVQYGHHELLDEFYKVFAWKMHELGTPVWGKKLFAGLLMEFPDSVEIALVKQGETTITGALLLSHKDRLYVPSAASYRKYLKMCPYHALYWNVIDRGSRTGYKYFDFGRSTIDSSTYHFKKQWVSTPTPLEWQYSLHRISEIPQINPSNPKYRFAKWLWSHLPLSAANLLGPSVIRNFP